MARTEQIYPMTLKTPFPTAANRREKSRTLGVADLDHREEELGLQPGWMRRPERDRGPRWSSKSPLTAVMGQARVCRGPPRACRHDCFEKYTLYYTLYMTY